MEMTPALQEAVGSTGIVSVMPDFPYEPTSPRGDIDMDEVLAAARALIYGSIRGWSSNDKNAFAVVIPKDNLIRLGRALGASGLHVTRA